MGKSCVRFKKLDDLALDVLGEAIRRVPSRTYIEYEESARTAAGARRTKPTQAVSATEPAKPAKRKPS